MTTLIPLKYNFDNNYIIFKYLEGDDVVYQRKKNIFVPDSGLTISNPQIEIPAYLIKMNQFGDRLLCGNIINNILVILSEYNEDGIILLIDFEGILEISQNFIEAFMKYQLETKNKVIIINQNVDVTNAIGEYAKSIFYIKNAED